jgi:transcriptional regulator
MYATASARELRSAVLLEAIRQIQLAALIINPEEGFEASHVPMVVSSREGGCLLQCHVARANPLWELVGSGCSALAIFQGPHAYVHPGWFTSVAAEDTAVPTWTYIAIHVHGHLGVVRDERWLRRHLSELASINEAHRPKPWSPSNVAPRHMEGLLQGIVGLELTVQRMEGSWKMAQSLPPPDKHAVAAALAASDCPRETEVATVMEGLLRGDTKPR